MAIAGSPPRSSPALTPPGEEEEIDYVEESDLERQLEAVAEQIEQNTETVKEIGEERYRQNCLLFMRKCIGVHVTF